ncbi:MAG TPA: GH92 family glycosyl hydrolase [Arachidicoccus sp.]|nr:GH92 family glycosyl hydrolase [Arachidicoccus sp.]
MPVFVNRKACSISLISEDTHFKRSLSEVFMHFKSRRKFVLFSLIIFGSLTATITAVCAQTGHRGGQPSAKNLPGASFTTTKDNYARLVNTMVGTAAAGNTYPGATYPFGMVQFTRTYFSSQAGFVVNQLSGAGCDHMGNFPVLPLDGALKVSPGNIQKLRTDIAGESGTAGFYSATVNQDIQANLTVTAHTGLARFRFFSEKSADSNKATIIIGGGVASNPVSASAIVITGKNSLEGYAEGGSFCGVAAAYKIYFVAQFDRAATDFGIWKGDTLFSKGSFAEGANSGAYFTFDLKGVNGGIGNSASETGKQSPMVQYKIGISYVSVENARQNLQAENAGWDFAAVKSAAETRWNSYLSRIEVKAAKKGADEPAGIRQFYTHLYHSFIHPNICSDVNGQYKGADDKIYQSNRPQYTSFSNWDTYRTQIQLLSILAPVEVSDMVASLGDFATQAGGGFPRWVLANRETGIMQGDPSTILVANAYAFGARNYDGRKLLQIMVHGATDPTANAQGFLTRPGLQQYIDKGYYDASMQLEYNSADFAISRFALGATDDQYLSGSFLGRAQSWKNLYNPKRKWLQSRNPDGSWKDMNADWRESTFKNYFWMVPFNLKALIDTIGGKKAAEKRLDELFVRLDANYGQQWFASGNEPSFGIPWVYNWAGAPYKAQEIVHRIIKEQYFDSADGLPGNDDLGAMGAYYVFCALGLYPEIPGVGGFSIASPFFPSIKIHLPGGDLTITGGDADKPYIHSLKINGTSYNNSWLPWAKIAGGGTLSYDLSSKPDKNWGAKVAPPSFE